MLRSKFGKLCNKSIINNANTYFSTYQIKSAYFLYLLACLQNFAGGLLWPTSRRNREITHRCSTLHPSFRPGVTISRKCNDNGTWGLVDDSSCTGLNNAIPTLIISFVVNVSQVDAQLVVDNVSLHNS